MALTHSACMTLDKSFYLSKEVMWIPYIYVFQGDMRLRYWLFFQNHKNGVREQGELLALGAMHPAKQILIPFNLILVQSS